MGKDFTECRSFQMATISDKVSIVDFSHRFILELLDIGHIVLMVIKKKVRGRHPVPIDHGEQAHVGIALIIDWHSSGNNRPTVFLLGLHLGLLGGFVGDAN